MYADIKEILDQPSYEESVPESQIDEEEVKMANLVAILGPGVHGKVTLERLHYIAHMAPKFVEDESRVTPKDFETATEE